MTVNPDERIERLRDRIETSDELEDADREALLSFSDKLRLLSSRYSDHRHEHLLRRCTIMAEAVGGLADALDDRDAAEEIVRWIHREYDNEESNRDYRGSLRMFGKHASDGDEIPESIAWIPGGTSRNYDPAPNPGDMLHWDEDVIPMLEAADYSRDAALIAVAWDSGARSGEIRDLAIGDVTDHDRGYRVTVDGKTGQRTVPLIPSVPYLQRWLEDHPGGDDATAPLWSKLTTAEPISYGMIRKILRTTAADAGVEKPVTLTNLRKSSASYLASRGVNQAVLEEHHGWRRGSDVAARYVSVFADASDRAIAQAHGVEVADEDEPDPLAPLPCPRCSEPTPRDRDDCMHCGQTLDVEVHQLTEALIQRLDERLVKAEDADDRATAIEMRRDLEQNPGDVDTDDLHQLVSSLESRSN